MMSWLQTQSGKRFWPLNPRVEDVDIKDIAHALSLLCRFAGHVSEFYSVAQHSILVCRELPEEFKLWGLLHDAAEAYTSDVPKPLKAGLPDFCRAEHRIEAVIAEAFGLELPKPKAVKVVETQLLLTEKRDLLTPGPWTWKAEEAGVKPWEWKIAPWKPREAEDMFLGCFGALT